MVGKTVLFTTTCVFQDTGRENKGDGVTECYALFCFILGSFSVTNAPNTLASLSKWKTIAIIFLGKHFKEDINSALHLNKHTSIAIYRHSVLFLTSLMTG